MYIFIPELFTQWKMYKSIVSNVINIMFIDQNLFTLKILYSQSYCFLKHL